MAHYSAVVPLSASSTLIAVRSNGFLPVFPSSFPSLCPCRPPGGAGCPSLPGFFGERLRSLSNPCTISA